MCAPVVVCEYTSLYAHWAPYVCTRLMEPCSVMLRFRVCRCCFTQPRYRLGLRNHPEPGSKDSSLSCKSAKIMATDKKPVGANAPPRAFRRPADSAIASSSSNTLASTGLQFRALSSFRNPVAKSSYRDVTADSRIELFRRSPQERLSEPSRRRRGSRLEMMRWGGAENIGNVRSS